MKLLNVSILCLGMLPALSFGEEVPAENAVESAVEKTVEKNEAAKDEIAKGVASEVTEAVAPAENASEADIAAGSSSATADSTLGNSASAVEFVAVAEPEEESEELDSLENSNLADGTLQFLDFSGAHFPTLHGARINSPYGIRRFRLHRGVDLHISIGDSIVAVYPGKVIVSKYNRRGYGHYVMIEHANGTRTLYGHLKKRLVKVGDMVEGGQLVGWGGNTGRSTGPHLHFEIRYGEINIDPATVFNLEEGTLLENSEQYALAPAVESHNEIQKELSKHRYHRIRPGDTLGRIAIKYGTTIERLCRLNGIKRTSILRIGQTLRCS